MRMAIACRRGSGMSLRMTWREECTSCWPRHTDHSDISTTIYSPARTSPRRTATQTIRRPCARRPQLDQLTAGQMQLDHLKKVLKSCARFAIGQVLPLLYITSSSHSWVTSQGVLVYNTHTDSAVLLVYYMDSYSYAIRTRQTWGLKNEAACVFPSFYAHVYSKVFVVLFESCLYLGIWACRRLLWFFIWKMYKDCEDIRRVEMLCLKESYGKRNSLWL
jgi:hypothetical protein